MKDRRGEIIYIGKAKNLKRRVSSYFQKNHEDFKTNELVSKIHDIEFIVTRNEVEALILEARLIKQHQPRYNMVLKENQPYAYIKITDEEFPRLMITRRIDKDGKYFGPYVSGRGRRALLWTTARLFGLRTGKMTSHSSKELYKLLTEIKEQKLKEVSPANYAKNVKLAELFLRGKKEKLIKVFEQRMKQASREQNFELAKIYRDQLQSLKNITEEQLVYLPKSYDQDIVNYLLIDQRLQVQIFHITKGVITARQEYQLPLSNDNVGEAIFNFLEQYYLTRSLPKEIVIPTKLPEQKLLADYLSEIKGEKVLLTIPQQGDRKELLGLVKKNILTKLADNPLVELQARLNLPRLPVEIDGFDISNISGTNAVGSCVHFTNAKPNKNLYRKFKIKTVSGINDFAMMREVVGRRYVRESEIKTSGESWGLPDLILVDGGKGQLNIVVKVLKSLKLNVPVISLAKRLEEVFVPNQSKSILLPRNSAAQKLLQNIRDEAHRFAVSYHHKLRKQEIK